MEVTPKKVFIIFVGEHFLAKVAQNFSGKFREIRAKILRNPKNLPAPKPMMKRRLRPVPPLLREQRGKFPRHVSILRRPCAYYSTHTLFTRCYKLQCVTVINIYYKRSPKTEQFITAKISDNALKQGSRTHSVLRQPSSQLKKHARLRECLVE